MDRNTASPNLDVLRSLAVLFVLLFHLLLYFQHTTVHQFPLHSIGHWGVLIFFVHTSLVLMYSLERQDLETPLPSLFVQFIVRRIFRIYPLSVLVVLTIALFQLPVGHLVHGQFIAVHLGWEGLLANLFLVQDLIHGESITAVLWTLPYELHMYILLPLLFVLVKRVRSLVLIVPVLCGALVLAKCSPWFQRHGFPDFLIYVPCFLGGVLAYRISSLRGLRLQAWLWPVTLGCLTVVFLKYPSPSNAWWCCLALGILIPQFREISSPVVSKASQYIARYSYGIYLTHFIVIYFVFSRFNYLSNVGKIFLFLFFVTIVPVITYHAVEKPWIQFGHNLTEP